LSVLFRNPQRELIRELMPRPAVARLEFGIHEGFKEGFD
jgi:hypothetical protein